MVSLRTCCWSLPELSWTCMAGSGFHRFSVHTNLTWLVCKNPDWSPCRLLYSCVSAEVQCDICNDSEWIAHWFTVYSGEHYWVYSCLSVFGTANICILCCIFPCTFIFKYLFICCCVCMREHVSHAHTGLSHVHVLACRCHSMCVEVGGTL